MPKKPMPLSPVYGFSFRCTSVSCLLLRYAYFYQRPSLIYCDNHVHCNAHGHSTGTDVRWKPFQCHYLLPARQLRCWQTWCAALLENSSQRASRGCVGMHSEQHQTVPPVCLVRYQLDWAWPCGAISFAVWPVLPSGAGKACATLSRQTHGRCFCSKGRFAVDSRCTLSLLE